MIELHKRKPRLHRVEKQSAPSLAGTLMSTTEGSGEQGWVVSYADLLMILLCFFVMFYSTSPESQDSVLHKILLSEGKNTESTEPVVQPVTPAVEGVQTSAKATLFSRLTKDLSTNQLSVKPQLDSLTIEFPDNVFAKGSSNLDLKQRETLVKLFERLIPYQKEINVMLVGHTDTTQVVSLNKKGILDNFDLSTARAKSTYKTVMQTKFPESHLKIEGDSSFGRASRTLSVVIKPREILDGQK